MSKKTNASKISAFNPHAGPALGIKGAWPFEELHLQQIRLLPTDESKIESRRAVELARKFKFPHADQKIEFVPVFAANMFGVGTLQMAEALHAHRMMVALEKNIEPCEIARFLKDHKGQTAVPTVGFREDDGKRLMDIFKLSGRHKPQMIIIDVPNGHMQKMIDTVCDYRERYPQTVIVAGNVATGTMAKKLIQAGADMVKIGIGPGSACTTKLIAGTHRPQGGAARECAIAAHKEGGYALVDGGIRTAGDVAIALAVGGDAVMIGGAFAAHIQSGQPIYKDDKGSLWQEFMGSSSAAYMTRTMGEVAHYRAAEGELQWLPHKGDVLAPGAIINEIEGGVRSALSYAGAASVKEFSKMARRNYRGEDGGLLLVKADIASAGKGANPKIVGGESNPITGSAPRPELLP